MMDKKNMLKTILQKIIGDADKTESPADDMADMIDDKKPGMMRKITIIAAGKPDAEKVDSDGESLMDILKKKQKK